MKLEDGLQGIDITEQAVSKRFDSNAVEFFKQMIAKACQLLVDNHTEVLPLTQRFKRWQQRAIYLNFFSFFGEP